MYDKLTKKDIALMEAELEDRRLNQRPKIIEEVKRTDLLLEWAVQHGDEAEAERLREKLRKLTEM